MKATSGWISFGILAAIISSGCAHTPTGEVGAHERVVTASAPATGDYISIEDQRTGIRKGAELAMATAEGAEDSGLLPPKRMDELRLHVIPVGSGACHLVECPGLDADPILVDCGTTRVVPGVDWQADEVSDYVLSVLDQRDVKVVVSHADADHYRYIPRIIAPERVSSLWLGGQHADYPAGFRQWSEAVSLGGAPGQPRMAPELPVNWHNDGFAVADLACGDAEVFVLGVNNGQSKNDQSLMLSIDHGDFSVVFAGDATRVSQDAAIANFPQALTSTVMLSPHHGASTHGSNEVRWAEATTPLLVIYSAGASFGHPRCAAVESYRRVGSLLPAPSHDLRCGVSNSEVRNASTQLGEYNTHDSGAIIVTSDASLDSLRVVCLPGPC